MIKKLAILLVVIISIASGCNAKKPVEKIYLSDKYYNAGEFIKVESEYLNGNTKENYVLYTYNDFCSFKIPCDKIFLEFMEKYKIDFLSIPFEEFKNTSLYNKVRYAPSVIVVKSGEVVGYLDAEADEDLYRYQSVSAFEEWITKYIEVTKE